MMQRDAEVNTDKQMTYATLTYLAGDYESCLKNCEDFIKVKKYDLKGEEKKLYFDCLDKLYTKYKSALLELQFKDCKIEGKILDLSNLKKKQKNNIESEMQNICKRVIAIIENQLLKKVKEDENKTFYWTVKANFYRYAAELKGGKDRENFFNNSKNAFETAKQLKLKLPMISFARLYFTYQYSLNLHEIDNNLKGAIFSLETELKEIDNYILLNNPKMSEEYTNLRRKVKETLVLMKNIEPKEEEGKEEEKKVQ